MKLNWIERDEYAYAAIRLDWVAVRFEVFFKSNCAYLFGVKELGQFDTIEIAKAACEAEWERMKNELTSDRIERLEIALLTIAAKCGIQIDGGREEIEADRCLMCEIASKALGAE